MCGVETPRSHNITFSFFSKRAYSDAPNKSLIEQPKCLFKIIGFLYLAVFDINVIRRGHLAKKGHPSIYYSDEIMDQFLSDIAEVIGDLGMVMVLKIKRDIGNHDSVRHRKIIKSFRTKKHIIVLDPLINAERVIDKTSATLSIPFTSTGVIANYKGKPSAFYDPSDTLVNDENCTHGVDMLQNISDLKLWLSRVKFH